MKKAVKNTLQIMSFLIAAFGITALVIYFQMKHATPRARVSYTSHALYTGGLALENAYQKLSYLPPKGNTFYYGPFTEDVLEPLKFKDIQPKNDNPIFWGNDFPVDNERHHSLFPGEKQTVAYYGHGRDTNGFTLKFRGYPLRYFRSESGKHGLLIANGVDGDEDINLDTIRKTSETDFKQWGLTFINLCYDPTNGTISNGDIFRFVNLAVYLDEP